MEHGTNVSVVAGKALAATFSTKITLKNPVSGCCQNLSGLGNTVPPLVHLRLEAFADIVPMNLDEDPDVVSTTKVARVKQQAGFTDENWDLREWASSDGAFMRSALSGHRMSWRRT